jgi:hypothetical protein
MKKSRLTAIACSLTIFTLVDCASATIITSGDLAAASKEYSQTLAAPPDLSADTAQSLIVPVKSVNTQPDERLDYFRDNTAAASPHSESHVGLWLLLIAASILGFLSEVFHRRSCKR